MNRRPARGRGVVGPAAGTLGALVRWGGLAVVLAALLVPARAHAYVRYKTVYGFPFYWPQACVPVTAYPLSMTDANGGMQMTSAQILHAATAASDAWSGRAPTPPEEAGETQTCTYLQINVTESDGAAPVARLDYRNSLIFRTTSWCAPTDKAGECSYDPAALAITSVFADKTNGQVKDGDIEVNAKNFLWADLDVNPSTDRQDLQNALTHEMGHLIGLDHTCYIAASGASDPLDNNGNPVPDCSSADATVRATTMFASAIPGDTEKRTLAPDDIQAVCDIYPVASAPLLCPTEDEPPDAAACRCGLGAGAPGAGATLATAAGLALVFARRRRARRR